jgi:hypothetical protein
MVSVPTILHFCSDLFSINFIGQLNLKKNDVHFEFRDQINDLIYRALTC